MAWESGYVLLRAGEETGYWFSWGGAYMGPQFALAVSYYPALHGEEAFLTTNNTVAQNNGHWVYWITVRNVGGLNAYFKVVGGGL